MEDTNEVTLTGTILYPPAVQRLPNKVAYNFSVGVKSKTKTGYKVFRFACVSWDRDTNEWLEEELKVGTRVRIKGHLQENHMYIGDGESKKKFIYAKVCADDIEILPNESAEK